MHRWDKLKIVWVDKQSKENIYSWRCRKCELEINSEVKPDDDTLLLMYGYDEPITCDELVLDRIMAV